jgi:alkylation response protein AidB-like acyl-CoA dehydrogenase
MVIADERVEPLDAARRLAPEFTARASEAEALRTMPPDLVTKVRAADLFRLGLPRVLGGLELDPLRYLEVIEECSRADGSAGWTILIGNTTAFLAWLEPAVARAFAGDTIAPAASAFPPKAAAIPDGRGGFTISGRWSFNSGCPHADWFSNGVMVMDGPGPRLLPEGRPDWRFAFFPKDGVEIVETWDALGLRGTGSHDTQVSGLRVAEELTAAPLFEPARHDGPLWRFAFFELLGIMMSGFPLGVARRALDEFATYAQTTIRPGTQEHLADDLLTQIAYGKAEATLGSARSYVFDIIGSAWDTACGGDPLTPEQSAKIALAMKVAMQSALDVVDGLWAVGGARVVYDTHPLQRCFRDLHTASQHLAFHPDRYRAYSQVKLATS